MDPTLKIFLMVAASWIIAEIIKAAIRISSKKKLNSSILFRYGGMPSSHSTFVTASALSIALVDGFTTPFLIALGIWFLVIRDLTVVRGHIDRNAEKIKKLSKKNIKIDKIAHTIPEIAAGILLGFIISYALFFII